MDWTLVFSVALIGILSVFIALGVLSMAVALTGYLFKQSAERKAKANSASPGIQLRAQVKA